MTLIVSWIGVDTHGPGSAYIVSDSRFSWFTGQKFDYGKKVFASNRYPEIFGYSGDVLFPSTVLSQIIEMIDSNLLFDEEMTCDQKNQSVVQKLAHSFSKYPTDACSDILSIIHISRDTIVNGYPEFYCYLLEWTSSSGWKTSKIKIPDKSEVLLVMGSGKNEFITNYSRYNSSVNTGTSRNVFHCFIDTLFNISDTNCGGPPQLVGIYRKPNSSAQNYGIIFNDKRYFLGAETPYASYFDRIEWRNELFECCDGLTKRILGIAAKQPDLLSRK